MQEGSREEIAEGERDRMRSAFLNILRDWEQANRNLAYTRDFLQAIANTAYDPIVVVDSQARVVLWNEAATRVLGWSEEEAIGRPLTQFVPLRLHEDCLAGFGRFVATGRLSHGGAPMEVLAKTKLGQEISIELALSTCLNPDGELVVTAMATPDQFAAAAGLLMLKDSGVAAVWISGVTPEGDGQLTDLVRDVTTDLFR